MSSARLLDHDGTAPSPGALGTGGTEHCAAALTLAVLLLAGGAAGLVELALDGVVRDGVARWTHAAAAAALLLAAVPLLVRRRAGLWQTSGLVLLGDLAYVVAALCTEDPVRYAPPLVLLVPSVVAAWFLRPWMLAVHLVVTPVACWIALADSHPGAVALAVQVGVHAGVLDLAAVAVLVLRRRMERLLVETEALSHRDPLTGLANRRQLVDQAPRTWRQARRAGLRVAAMVLDLDHFKQVNDVHGHAAGDAVLRAVAAALAATVRPSDLLARVGGEELVVLGLVGDPTEAGRLAERLRHAVSATRSAYGHAVTASIGVALTNPVDGEDATDALWRLVDRADAAMYEAKQAGRDRVAAFSPPRPRATPTDEHLPSGHGRPAPGRLDPPTVPGTAGSPPVPRDPH
ncbi:GGDEF domain-containing protein [Geodermatophilus sp. URMC 62]|uniref:GGDEF domain-containing protein n=1 Tax=Geodermatophilus sp. URMC 62 TaxID=3423414 RepID=UPI00406C868C